jgi:hypothetical protein
LASNGLHRPVGVNRLEQKPVLRIDGGRFALADAEERCVEAGAVVEKPPQRDRPARDPWLGVVEIADIPSVGGNPTAARGSRRRPEVGRPFP